MRRRDLVFTQPLHIDICGSSCPITTSSPINATTFPYDPSPLDELPNCRAGEPAPGVYVPVNKFDADFFPVKIDNDQWTVANKYKFQPRECEWRHAGLKWADHEPCFERKRRVSIFGDSHARGLYDGLVHRMSGDTTFFRSSVSCRVYIECPKTQLAESGCAGCRTRTPIRTPPSGSCLCRLSGTNSVTTC